MAPPSPRRQPSAASQLPPELDFLNVFRAVQRVYLILQSTHRFLAPYVASLAALLRPLALAAAAYLPWIVRFLHWYCSFLVSVVRLGYGTFRVQTKGSYETIKPLTLYDVETNADCRRVREALSSLDLDVLIIPCADSREIEPSQFALRHRQQAMDLSSMKPPPVLVDDHHQAILSDPDEAVDHLYVHYAACPPWKLWKTLSPPRFIDPLADLLSLLARRSASPNRAVRPSLRIELYSLESCAQCRQVRLLLHGLALPYLLHNLPIGSARRRHVLAKLNYGRVQLPYLIDPNHAFSASEVSKILDHLIASYAAPPAPSSLSQ